MQNEEGMEVQRLACCFEQGMKAGNEAHLASSSEQRGRKAALHPSPQLAYSPPRQFCPGRSILLTLRQSSCIPGGAITDTVTFRSIAANKRNLKLSANELAALFEA